MRRSEADRIKNPVDPYTALKDIVKAPVPGKHPRTAVEQSIRTWTDSSRRDRISQ